MVMLWCPDYLAAQANRTPDQRPGPQFTVAVAPFYQFDAGIDDGGTMNVASYYFSVGALLPLKQDLMIGVGVIYEMDDFHFSGVRSLPIASPWDKVQRYGLAVPLTYTLNEQWRLVFVPMAQFSGETNARWSSSLVYGGVVSVSYGFGSRSFIGLGVGAFSNIEKISVFPFVAVNWQITDRWRLQNPLQTSPAGPAGLELSYAIDKNWEIGIAGAYRYQRFRLNKNGPIPNGVGEYTRLPLVAKIAYTYNPFTFNLYGGVSLRNRLWLADPSGDGLYQTKHDPAALAGLNITARF